MKVQSIKVAFIIKEGDVLIDWVLSSDHKMVIALSVVCQQQTAQFENEILHWVLPLRDADEAGDDDSGGHSSQDKPEHEADCQGESHDEVGEAGHCRGLHEAGNEGGAEHHPWQVPQRHRVHL